MASKKGCYFEKSFNGAKNSAAAGEKSPAAAFEKDGYFCRHSETMIILSFAKKHRKGEITGELLFSRGIYAPILRRHIERQGINHIEVRVKRANTSL